MTATVTTYTCLACKGPVIGNALQCESCRSRPTEEIGKKPAKPAAARVPNPGIALGALPFDMPARAIAIVLPWSTLHSINGTWTIRTPEYQSAKRRAREIIADSLGPASQPLTCPVAVDVVLFVPDNRRRDLDNYEKLIYDALKELAYADDSLIDDKRIRRGGVDVDRPRAQIHVRPLE